MRPGSCFNVRFIVRASNLFLQNFYALCCPTVLLWMLFSPLCKRYSFSFRPFAVAGGHRRRFRTCVIFRFIRVSGGAQWRIVTLHLFIRFIVRMFRRVFRSASVRARRRSLRNVKSCIYRPRATSVLEFAAFRTD